MRQGRVVAAAVKTAAVGFSDGEKNMIRRVFQDGYGICKYKIWCSINIQKELLTICSGTELNAAKSALSYARLAVMSCEDRIFRLSSERNTSWDDGTWLTFMGDIVQTVFVDSEEPISDGESSIDLSGSSGDDFGHEYPVVSGNMLVPNTA